MTNRKLFLALILGLVSLPCALQARQLVLVSEKANPTSNLTAADLVKMFNAESRTWPDGKPITIVMRDPASTDMQLVLRKLLNMTPDQAHVFIHAHRPAIMIADSDDALLHFVAGSRGAIGVVDLYSLTQEVNVIKIDGKLPVEQGYLLRGN